MATVISKIRNYCFTDVNNSPLILFRILFGLLLLKDFYGAYTSGWIKEVFIDSSFRFTFIGFEFLNVLHGNGMYVYYAVMSLAAIFISVGFLYKPSAFILATMWTGIYLAQKSYYNNHFYLMVLLTWLMVFMPANRRLALDIKARLAKPSNVCNRWHIHIFIIQIAIVYTFAAIAKMYPDWLHAIPVKIWFKRYANYNHIGYFFRSDWFAYLVAYSGLLFDLLVVPALLWKRTRVLAVIAMVMFHFFNNFAFNIGVFPFLALSLNVFFFPASLFDRIIPKVRTPDASLKQSSKYQNISLILIFLYVIWQLLTPLRHHFYKGDVAWTEEGHRMSWRMMLRTKRGDAKFYIKEKRTDSTWTVLPEEHLLQHQAIFVAQKPDFAWQYAQYLKKYYKHKGINVSVYAECYCSLNGREKKLLINPDTDLAAEKWLPFTHHDWILLNYK